MRVVVNMILVSFLISISPVLAQLPGPVNPFLQHNNAAFPFHSITPDLIEDAASQVMALADKKIAAIIAADRAGRNSSNTLLAMDEVNYELSEVIQKLSLIQATSTKADVRAAAREHGNRIRLYTSNIALNENLYKALREFDHSAGSSLNSPQKKFLTETIEDFERMGMKLPPEKRNELEQINKKIIELGTSFQQNINDASDSLSFTRDQLKGLSEQDIASFPKVNGKLLVQVTGPNYVNILENASNSGTRKVFYLHYQNRAFPENIMVLDSLLYYRNELARKLGFSSYAEFALDDKMAGKPSVAWNFQDDLQNKLEPYVTDEMKIMRELKKKLSPAEPDTLFAWDIAFYTKKLKDEKYKLNTDEVKQYFEISNTIAGMFRVYEQLFNISIRKTDNVPLWFDKVQSYEIYNEGKKAGTFYLDLYPRKNKYTHFACFSIGQYRKTDSTEILPVASLVCNFPEPGNSEPSLLPHRDVITLFHEFGHLVHALLARPALSSQGPFSVKRDFIEAPSQFLENWCWQYPSLSIIAKHYKSGKPLPLSLFNKMKSAQNVNIAGFYMRQLYLGYIDLDYEDHYDKVKQEGIINTAKRWFPIQQVPYPEGSHFIASFGHLYGYAAGYYGYLWSRVYAQDMFSVFEKNGVMDRKTGIRYKNMVLEKGSSVPEMQMITAFLGRQPNSAAFLHSLGLNDSATVGRSSALSSDKKWVQLFNGKDLTGWKVKIRNYKLYENPNNTFYVEDGKLKVKYHPDSSFKERFGHIFYEKPFSNYLLRVEYRFTGKQAKDGPGWAYRNSGIMVHCQSPESMLKDQDFPISIEVQLLGGDSTGERSTCNLCTPGTHVVMDGKLVTQHCINSTSKTFRGDEWVTAEVLVMGDSIIKHIVNGDTVLVYEKPQIGGEVVSGFDPKVKKDGKLLSSGYISLQSESHPVEFRKVEILDLSPGKEL